MFDSKRKPQVNASGTPKKTKNAFISTGEKISAETLSGNFAKKYSHTDDPFVTQFGSVGQYKERRPFNDIASDCESLWAINKRLTIVFILYLRMITRVVTLFNGLSTSISQKGAELKYESIMRMLWLYMKRPESFWKNIGLFVSVGSWKDIFLMLQYDYIYNGWDGKILDWSRMADLILTGLENENTVNLIKKYLPQIKARSKCTTIESEAGTIIAKYICNRLFGDDDYKHYKKYRKLKSSGTAHSWQQLISRQEFDRIDFSKIHGRALSLLVRSKFLKNHGLVDKYTAWINKPDNTNVKYTGFVHELFAPCDNYRSLVSIPQHEQETINKQFDTLVRKAGDKPMTKYIVVRDTSGSMRSIAKGTNMSSNSIAKALALYFSEFLTGVFANTWIEFNKVAKLHEWVGNTPLEKWYNDKTSAIGNTNFLSVIKLFVNIKSQGVPEEDFPSGILCISDGEFDASQLGDTNVKAAKEMLLEAGFSKEYVDNFVIVLWNIPNSFYCNSSTKFETYEGSYTNVFYFGGYSASVISFLSGKVKTARELFDAAMDQEILNMVEL